MAIQEPSIDHLERLHTIFLFANPSFFSSTSNNTKQKLLDLFSVILEQEYFKANLAWFVVWDKSIDEKYPKSYFLKGDDSKARKVVNMYKSLNWINSFSQYVTIPSEFCVKNNIEDTSFIFTTEDFGVEQMNNNRYLVFLSLKDIVSKITKRAIPEDVNRSLEEKVINELKDYHTQLSENDDLITPIFNTLRNIFPETGITKESVANLLNCYFWLRLAYPEDWKTILYFPGIIAKKVESVPFGVNIGFRKPPSKDVILFLKKISLLFFTRYSVDYFETKVIKERDIRIATFREVYHDVGRHIIPPILKVLRQREIKQEDIDEASWLVDYLRNRLELLRLFSIDGGGANKTAFPIKQRINIIYEKLSFGNKEKLKMIFSDNDNCEIYTNAISFDLIFENLIINSDRHGGKPRKIKTVLINIKILKNDNNICVNYCDDGKGFSEKERERVSRWLKGLFKDDEIHNDKGLGFFMIQKACDFMGADFDIEWGEINHSVYKPNFIFIIGKE